MQGQRAACLSTCHASISLSQHKVVLTGTLRHQQQAAEPLLLCAGATQTVAKLATVWVACVPCTVERGAHAPASACMLVHVPHVQQLQLTRMCCQYPQ
jgi:hypothetical protein